MGRTLPAFFFAAALIFLIFPASAGAADPFLKTLLEEARSNNPEIKALQERLKAAGARARAEGALDDPTFKVEMEDLDKDRPLNNGPGNAMLTRYTVSQMFPFPGKRSLREQIAFKEAAAAGAELMAKELDVSFMVKEAYYEFALLAEAIRINSEIKELLGRMSGIADARYSTGQVSQQDVIKVNVELTMLSNEIITLEARKEIAASRLKSVLNRPQEGKLEGPVLTRERPSFDTGELLKRAVEQNPDVKMVEAEAEANELGVKLARKDYYPDLMLGVAPIQRDGRFDSYDLMFQVNIPIWRGKYNSRVAEASSNATALRSKAAAQKNSIAYEVKGAAVKVEAAERMMTLFETSLLPQVELSFESALKNYQAGRIDFLALLDSERDLKRTRIEYLKTIAEYRKSVAELEKAAGTDL